MTKTQKTALASSSVAAAGVGTWLMLSPNAVPEPPVTVLTLAAVDPYQHNATRYQFERSDLPDGPWTVITSGPSPLVSVVAGAPQGFYRVGVNRVE